MTRLHSLGLVVLLSISPAMHAVDWPSMPDWASWDNVSGYFTTQAVTNGLNNTRDFTCDTSQALYDAIKSHPYIAAGIAAGTITVGGLLYKAKQKYAAYKKRQQEDDDLVFAYVLEQVLQDEEYARQLQGQLNGGVEASAPAEADYFFVEEQITSDEDFARRLQEQLNGFFARHDVNGDAALAELMFRQEEAALRSRNEQIAQDEAYARAIEAQG